MSMHPDLPVAAETTSRLQLAFEGGLEDLGIDALPHWCCCMSCGHNAAGECLPPGSVYVFFHWQNTEGAVDSDHIHLAYGFTDETSTEATEVAGELIVTALNSLGVDVDWDGDSAQCLCVGTTPEDRAWLQVLLDADVAEAEAEEMEEDARMMRLSHLVRRWRRRTFVRKIARRRIGKAMMEWGARPGGVLYRHAERRFKTCTTTN